VRFDVRCKAQGIFYIELHRIKNTAGFSSGFIEKKEKPEL
jgi:hypothetical protein